MNHASALRSNLFESLVNHVALPPRLPGKEDSNLDQIQSALTGYLIDASRTIREKTRSECSRQWGSVETLLHTCKILNAGGKLNKTSLLTHFRNLERKDRLILHIAEQNAGLLIQRQHDVDGDTVTFEAFEGSPLSENVLAAEKALEWDFPGCAVAIPYSVFDDPSFQNELAALLEQASTESVKRFAARTQKAGSLIFESRDTVDPAIITQMLMTMLEVNGHRVFPTLLRKRVRDDVCWTDGAERPWRRCPYWLVLRVGLGRHLCTLYGGEAGKAYYKFLLCLALAGLMKDALDHLSPEILALLNAKLARRIVKLEVDKDRVSSETRLIYESLLNSIGPILSTITKRTKNKIEGEWNHFKESIQRRIRRLPPYAEKNDLRLTLPNSGAHLHQVLSWYRCMGSAPAMSRPYQLPAEFDVSAAMSTHFVAFSRHYYSLSDFEVDIEERVSNQSDLITNPEKRCMEIAENINGYINDVAGAYDHGPEQKSVMLLTVMELWMSMDRAATNLFDLLSDYSPGIPPEILEVLQLTNLTDMYRLQGIEQYLRDRHTKSNFSRRTIFDNPVKGCFSDRYFQESRDSQRLQDLQQDIEEWAEAARQRKKKEWEELSSEFEELERSIAQATCLFTTDEFRLIHDDKHCRKCFLRRQARRMKIEIHEHPLPSDSVQAKAVVFELVCPEAFEAYRNATWKILGSLARPSTVQAVEPRLLISDYSGLRAFMQRTSHGISLASTKKPSSLTHYSHVRFPVALEDVCLANGMKLEYFDVATKAWPGRDAPKVTFAHHCQINLPPRSPFSFVQFSNKFAVESDGPSSYEILASQTKCPSGLNVQEFIAYQTLLSGKSRRWPQMLIELGSSNLNFSSEATALLMAQLALQAGPYHKSDPLRTVHRIFRDDLFCQRLLAQIDQRLDGISSNWREINCVHMLLTLTLKLCSIGPVLVIGEALKLLEKIRAVTFKWVSELRLEIHRSTDASTSQRCSRYALWAALLCKKTFAQHVWDVDTTHSQDQHSAALRCFIECSITLQDNLFGDPAALPTLARNALIADLKMTYRIRDVLLRSLMASPQSLESAVDRVWPQPEGQTTTRSYSPLESLESPDEWWIKSTMRSTEQNNQQTIHYHLLGGHLLVDGQPIGKLPAKHRESFVLGALFGNQSLLTYPSGRPGMSYMLAFTKDGHQIHLGFRNKAIIVHAYIHNTVLEYVPPGVFGNESNFDLPASLVDDCVHWLDLRTGILEIRQRPAIWNFKPSNWRLNLSTRRAERRNSSLVDPHSPLFREVALIFDHFEHGRRLTIFQPRKWTLSVELRRLELSFSVIPNGALGGLLKCRQLQSIIDQNQDARTWYGLKSKLVLRDTVNPRQRSIIVPMGPISRNRNKFHVEVKLENEGKYGRFTINDVLGRLDCPTEPRLLYWKALCHALTSFVVPDPLTGRTGTEEALHCLKSSYCQPWTPLNPGPFGILQLIADLTPRREYYPAGMKKMQHVSWNHDLTTTIQHDGFKSLVEAICEKSKKLSAFTLEKTERPSLQSGPDTAHLLRRSYLRRCLYERPDPDHRQQTAADLPYHARDRRQSSQECRNVFESATLIRNWPSEMPQIPALAGILLNWPTIGGYDRSFDRILLSDLLDVHFALEWGPLVNLCRASDTKDMYRLMFLFTVISFREDSEMDVVRTLIAFAVLEELKALDPPKWQSYSNFRPDHIPSVDYLVQLVKHCCVPYPGDERSTFQCTLGSKLRRKLEAAERAHEEQTERDCKAFAQFLLAQWPCPEPTTEEVSQTLLLDVSQAFKIISSEYLRLYQNMELSHHIAQIQPILDLHCTGCRIELPISCSEDQDIIHTRQRGGELATLSQFLLQKTGPIMCRKPQSMISNVGRSSLGGENDHHVGLKLQKENFSDRFRGPTDKKCAVSSVSREIQELGCIIDGILDSKSTVQQQYGRDLKQSLEALRVLGSAPKQAEETIMPETLLHKIFVAEKQVEDDFQKLSMVFNQHFCAQWLKEGGLWPCITPVTLLEQLRSTSGTIFGSGMKESLVAYAVSVTALQRLLRIDDAQRRGDKQRLHEELSNPGHGNWQPLKSPDWLLLEIDANILIRHDQVEVADATIAPASGSNSVLQMNMGQGKTSCIMPMVAAILADTKQLMRVVVPKSLLLQTAQLLQARLGGLLGREVRHVPFSRKTPTNSETIKAFFNLHKEVRASSGVIVALPEHTLSFMLSGLQRLADGPIPEATQMVNVQAWIRQFSRDVLDESDFTLAVRTQLIYPSGSQMTVDGHPHRWWIAETLLQLVDGHLWNLQQDFPQSIEVVRRSQGGFPFVFFLSKDVEDELIARLVKDVLRGLIPTIPIRECKLSERLAIKHFISESSIRPAVAEIIRGIFPDKRAARQAIYLLRGLLVHRILLLTLKKRWNVQYGLHPGRDPIAVPFHAKGVPSEQAEWGHPDVAILFTCLAFYYGGLNFAQLRQSLEHVLKSDDPSSEYDRWNHSSKNLPDSLREWNVINVDDEAQLMEIWQHLRYKIVVIDYFLNHFVFPKHAKQFRMKLQASGWDIPLSSNATTSVTKYPKPLTTGFSGTNDNRFLLPLTIKQADLPGLSHTNAEVLTYLLQPRNRAYVRAADIHGRHIGELGLLQMLYSRSIRMLIDAGAQVLEMDNVSLAKAWLKVDKEALAAVYFNTENKPVVIYRHGIETPLSVSPFAENLGECLVYLDEAHTRGTDLKMPTNATGALTLGLGQTKDQTVQAAMRLRQLATSQSVVFFAPPEVHQSILDVRRKGLHASIDSYDVICWLLQQTCSGIEQLQPLYFSHGSDFCRRQQAALDNRDFLVDAAQRAAYLDEIRQTEQQTLTKLYGPRLKPKSANFKPSSPQGAAYMKELNFRRKGFQDTGNAVHGSALQEVEQEREVAFEVEAVREVEKPVHYSPLSFSGLHKDIMSFVKTGRLAVGDGGYEHASVALRRTGLGLKHGINSEAAVSKLFVSKEFTRTVSIPLGCTNDNFLRQVNWILWSVVTNTALIIIPEEAELCLSLVQDAPEALTHLLTYAAPVTRKMLHFNNLTFYAVPSLPTGWKPPPWLTIELGIFAGRLYFEYDEYSDMRKYLGCRQDNSARVDEPREDAMSPTNKLHEPDMDGARDSVEEEEKETETSTGQQVQKSFTAKPLVFLQEWLAMRRKGQDFTHTPMGHVCQGKTLAASHPFFKNRLENGGSPGSGPGKPSAWKRNSGTGADADTCADPGATSDLDYPDEEDYFVQNEHGEGEKGGVYEESERSGSDDKSSREGDDDDDDEKSSVRDDEDSDGSSGSRGWTSALSQSTY